MKKHLPSIIFLSIIPYSVIALFLITLNNQLMDVIFKKNILWIFLLLFIVYFFGFIVSFVFVIRILINKEEAQNIALVNMVVKLVHIPAYIVIFFFALLTFLTIFTAGISVIFYIFYVLTIIISGIIGLPAIIKLLVNKKLKIGTVIGLIILQFTFCADVFSSIHLYKRSKVNTAL